MKADANETRNRAGRRLWFRVAIGALAAVLAVQGFWLYRQCGSDGGGPDRAAAGRLPHKLELYLPAAVEADAAFDHRALTDRVLQRLAVFAGGASAQEIRGCWIAGDGNAVFESIVVCFVYCRADQLEAGSRLLRILATELRDALRQESVAIVIDGVMEFL